MRWSASACGCLFQHTKGRGASMKRLCLLLAFVFVVVPAAHARAADQFDANGVQINYTDQGTGEPVVLIHGFTMSLDPAWNAPGIMAALDAARYRVIALDCRGHGASGKPHDPQQYGLEMATDVVRLLDHLNIERAHVVGYSMGGLITNKLRAMHPERLLTATLGGAGWAGENGEGAGAISFRELAEALDHNDLGPLVRGLAPPGAPEPTDAVIAATNAALLASNDPKALAAVVRGFADLSQISAENLRANAVPTLAIVGDLDPLSADVERLAGVMASLDVVEIPGATHMTAFSDALFIESLVKFLSKHSGN